MSESKGRIRIVRHVLSEDEVEAALDRGAEISPMTNHHGAYRPALAVEPEQEGRRMNKLAKIPVVAVAFALIFAVIFGGALITIAFFGYYVHPIIGFLLGLGWVVAMGAAMADRLTDLINSLRD